MAEDYIDESHALISSRRLEGTSVFGVEGDHLGEVHSAMIDKRSGKVAYALLSFGGFLGFAERVHPIPWQMLAYDVARDGYVVELTRRQLEDAPWLTLDEADRPRWRNHEEEMIAYYGQLPWWGL